MLITTHTRLRVKEVPHLTWVKYRSIAPKTTSLCDVTQLYIIQLQNYSGELLGRGGGGGSGDLGDPMVFRAKRGGIRYRRLSIKRKI